MRQRSPHGDVGKHDDAATIRSSNQAFRRHLPVLGMRLVLRQGRDVLARVAQGDQLAAIG